MLCDRVLGNAADAAPAAAIKLPLTWQQCRARAVQKTLPDGRTVRILLPPGVVLRHGDIIHEEPMVIIDLVPAAVLAVESPSPADLLRIVYAMGNLHLPLEIVGENILTPDDGPARSVFRELGVSGTEHIRRFNPLPLPNGLIFRVSDGFVIERTPGR